MNDSPTVTLYVKEGCHLCEDARQMLAGLRSRYPHRLDVIDIASDPTLYRRYWDQVPVLATAESEQPAPLTPAIVERTLAELAR